MRAKSEGACYYLPAASTTLAPATILCLILARAIFTLNFITLIATSFSTKRCWQQHRRKNRILTAAAVTRSVNCARATARAALLHATSEAANLAQYRRRALHRRRRVCKNFLLIIAAILCLTARTADALSDA
jgi:Mg2+/citrate symporter